MAPGPGRNVQLSASALQPTTSIYCSLVPRCALVSQWAPRLWERHTTPARPQRWRSAPRQAERQLEEKKKPKTLQHGWDSQGGGAPVFFPPLSFRLSSRKKKTHQKKKNPKYSPNDATNRCGGEGRREGGLKCGHGWEKKKNDSKFWCSLFWCFLVP